MSLHLVERNSEIVNAESCKRQIQVWNVNKIKDPRRVKFSEINPASSKKIFCKSAGDLKYSFNLEKVHDNTVLSSSFVFSPRT